jgi:hypothetical protein
LLPDKLFPNQPTPDEDNSSRQEHQSCSGSKADIGLASIDVRFTSKSGHSAAGAIGAGSEERPAEWCGWWMRQHLGGHYGPEFNVARNWLNAGRPLDGPRTGAIGVKAHHVFQVIRVVDRDHALAISGNDHNDVRTRIRSTSDVIGWRDVTEDNTVADRPTADNATNDKTEAGKVRSDKGTDDTSVQEPLTPAR